MFFYTANNLQYVLLTFLKLLAAREVPLNSRLQVQPRVQARASQLAPRGLLAVTGLAGRGPRVQLAVSGSKKMH